MAERESGDAATEALVRDEPPGSVVDPATRIAQIADDLRALAANGLHYGTNPYDIERYHRIQRLSAELLSMVDGRSADEIGRIMQEDVGVRTPAVAVDAAIFDPEGRILLVQRAENGQWCLPGGAADVGESPSAAAEREVLEETGLRVKARRVVGVYDNRSWRVRSIARHAYYLVFECDVLGGELTPSLETTGFRWCTEEEAVALPLYRAHVYKVPEAFRLHRMPDAPTAFH